MTQTIREAVEHEYERTRTAIPLIEPITAEIGRGVMSTFKRFGKGRHCASLNTGDCFAYACARSLDLPLLFKGDNFPHTDIAAA